MLGFLSPACSRLSLSASLAALLALGAAGCSRFEKVSGDGHTTSVFHGVKVNGGRAMHGHKGSRSALTLSDDFQVPDSPAPHWQVVDSKGQAYLLNRLVIKDDKFNRSITVPAYVPDIARVQIWCAWAETLLGEASFSSPVE